MVKQDKIGTNKTMQAWPADHVERRSVESLIPYARNARTHSDAQVAQLAASIQEWGWTTPVLIDETGGIIAGHGRVMAARKLGIEDVPVMVAAGWSEAQRRAYVLADNKLALNSGWDMDLLKVELQDVGELGFNLDKIGFDLDEMAALFDEPDFAPGEESDQGKLDELSPKMCQCPNCGQDFDLREHAKG
jgi:ParB-like chromosome segregation protein Spo0J